MPLDVIKCLRCKRSARHGSPAYAGARGIVGEGHWCGNCVEKYGEPKGCPDFSIENRGNIDAMGRLLGRDGSVPKVTPAEAAVIEKDTKEELAKGRRERREVGTSKHRLKFRRMGVIPSATMEDPNGHYGNEPGDTKIEKKLKRDGLAI